jgi:AcrR family transcriptional regulator
MAPGVRDQMVRSALALFAERGIAGTKLTDVVAHAGAPRGSIYHHFPGGKDELVSAALDALAVAAPESLAGLRGRDEAGVIDGFLDGWVRLLEATDFQGGCSVLGITVTTEDPAVRASAGDVFAAWVDTLADLLDPTGAAPDDAHTLAWTLLSSAEGAVVLCRARGSLEPLEAVRRQLHRGRGSA